MSAHPKNPTQREATSYSEMAVVFSERIVCAFVRSKQGVVKMTLDAGPTGMKLQGNGKLVWKVPRGKRLQTESIIISITDKTEQQIFHSFDLNVE